MESDLDKRADDVADGLDGLDTDITIIGGKLDDLITGIVSVSADSGKETIYNLSGQQQRILGKGMNIVTYPNGQVKKVLVK